MGCVTRRAYITEPTLTLEVCLHEGILSLKNRKMFLVIASQFVNPKASQRFDDWSRSYVTKQFFSRERALVCYDRYAAAMLPARDALLASMQS